MTNDYDLLCDNLITDIIVKYNITYEPYMYIIWKYSNIDVHVKL